MWCVQYSLMMAQSFVMPWCQTISLVRAICRQFRKIRIHFACMHTASHIDIDNETKTDWNVKRASLIIHNNNNYQKGRENKLATHQDEGEPNQEQVEGGKSIRIVWSFLVVRFCLSHIMHAHNNIQAAKTVKWSRLGVGMYDVRS